MSANPSTKPAAARRALVAVAVPTTMAALLCTATLAGTAFASGSSSSATAPCSTVSGTPATGKSATGTPTTAAPTAGGTAKPTVAPTSTPVPTATATSDKGSSSTPTTAPPTPTASATASGPGGIWGWLNGVWQLLFPSTDQVSDNAPHPAAAGALHDQPVADSGSNHTSPAKPGTVKSNPVKKTDSTPGCAPTTAVPLHKDEAAPAQAVGAIIPWHLSTPSMTMYGLTFNGVDTINTVNGAEQVLDFTVNKVDIESMVTYSYPGGPNGPRQYNNAGSGTTTVLTNVHLWTTTMTASVYGLIQVTLTPTSPITTILGVAQGFTIPIPVVFTDVNADNALLSSGGLNVPGFAGFSGS